jgi:hypothetical protein
MVSMKKGITFKKLAAFAIVLLMFLVALSPAQTVSGVVITNFSSGNSEERYVFTNEGTLDNASLRVPVDGVVLSASFDVTGEGTTSNYPLNVRTYVGSMSNQVYQFQGPSYGRMGYQNAFVGGVGSKTFAFDHQGSDSSLTVRLPRGAKIVDAQVRIGGELHDAGWANPSRLNERVGNNNLPIDVGYRSAPRLVDYDGDGDLDIITGGRQYSGGRWQTVFYYENTGTKSKMNWTYDISDFTTVMRAGNYAASPRLIDLDGDNDYDIVIGGYYGDLILYWNTGSASSPTWTYNGSGASSVFYAIDEGYYAAPDFADMDNDGDDDLAYGRYAYQGGESNVGVSSYRNDYANGVYSWSSSNFFGGIKTDTLSYPTVIDYDGDGDFDLFVGYQNGTIGYYENTGTKANPKWTQRTKVQGNIDVGTLAGPTVGDLDNDGDLDLVVGAQDGNLYYYEALKSYPLLPSLDIGADGDNEWTYNGDLKTKVIANNLATEIQSHIKADGRPAFRDGWGNVFDDITFKFSSGSAGKLVVDQLRIHYVYTAKTHDFTDILNKWINDHEDEADEEGYIKVPIIIYSARAGTVKVSNLKIEIDRPPVWTNIPSTYAIDEDTRNDKLIDLWQYVSDDLTEPSKLAIELEQLDQKGVVDVKLVAGRYVSVDSETGTANDNWNGKVKLMAFATDNRKLTSKSNIFSVDIRPVNDAPVLKGTPPSTILEDEVFKFSFSASDVDGDDLTFSFEGAPPGMAIIGPTVSWTPTNDDVGHYMILVSVTDPSGAWAYLNWSLEVINVNDPPTLSLPEVLTVTEGTPTYLSLIDHVSDVDDAVSDLKAEVEGEYISFDPGTWMLTILYPKESGVDEATLLVTVFDPSGDATTGEILLRIVRVERLALIGVPDQEAVEEDTWTFDIKPYLYNVEDFNKLSITTNSNHITVSGTKLTFHYPKDAVPSLQESVVVTARQLDEMATDSFTVRLLKLGHDLQLGVIPDQYVVEDEETTVDISPYILNFVDINAVSLSVTGSPHVTAFGKSLIFRYPLYYEKDTETIHVTIKENEFGDSGSFVVHIANGEDDFYLAAIPDVVVTETVPETFNIKVYIMNAENVDFIDASTDSPYADVNRFDIQLTYPAGFTGDAAVMTDTIRVKITDGFHEFVRAVTVHVNRLGKQLQLTGIGDKTVYEETELVIDVLPHIYNVDNIDDVTLTVDSAYVSLDGFVATFNYPSGVEQETVTFTVREGEDVATEIVIIYIERVPVKFEFGPIGSISITEDTTWVLNVEPFLKNMDPSASYTLGELSDYAEIDGFTIKFLYPEGPMNEIVRVNVTGTNGDFSEQDVFVHVKGVNDQPEFILDFDLDISVQEGEEPIVIDLTKHYEDDDTAKLHFRVSDKAEDLFVIDNENGTATVEFKMGATKPDDVTGAKFFAFDPDDPASETASNAFNVSFFEEGEEPPTPGPGPSTGPQIQNPSGGGGLLLAIALLIIIGGAGYVLWRRRMKKQ